MSTYFPTPEQMAHEWTRALGDLKWHLDMTPAEQRQVLRAWGIAREYEDREQLDAPARRAKA